MAHRSSKSNAFGARPSRFELVLFLIALPFISGCMSGNAGRALAIDPVTTQSIAPESSIQSDEEALMAAVADVDLDRQPDGPYAWANAFTGTTGVISQLSMPADTPGECRTFTSTIHRFDGISLVRGSGCRQTDGRWNLLGLEPVS